MNVELMIAGLAWFVLAAAHTAVGLRWVLPNLTVGRLPSTPFGPPSLTLRMVRFTWNVISVLLFAFGVLFIALASAPHADAKTLLLRWFVGLLLAGTATAAWTARGDWRSTLRLPLPVVCIFISIAVICWTAST